MRHEVWQKYEDKSRKHSKRKCKMLMSGRRQTPCLVVGMDMDGIIWTKEEGRDKYKWGRERERWRAVVFSTRNHFTDLKPNREQGNWKLLANYIRICQYDKFRFPGLNVPGVYNFPPRDFYTSKVLNYCSTSLSKDSISLLLACFPGKASSPLDAWAWSPSFTLDTSKDRKLILWKAGSFCSHVLT